MMARSLERVLPRQSPRLVAASVLRGEDDRSAAPCSAGEELYSLLSMPPPPLI